MAEVIPFRKPAPEPELPPAELVEDSYGPPDGAHAWRCNPCGENPEVDPTGEFCFYVTKEGVHCWTCHAIQYFS